MSTHCADVCNVFLGHYLFIYESVTAGVKNGRIVYSYKPGNTPRHKSTPTLHWDWFPKTCLTEL